MDELLEQFLLEGRELVQRAADDLLALERGGAAKDVLASAYRAVHTLKGSAALFDLAPMGAALHAAEDLLGDMRDGRLAIGADALGALLACVSACDAWLDQIAETGRLACDAPSVCNRLLAGLRPFAEDMKPRQEDPASVPAGSAPWLEPLMAGYSPSGEEDAPLVAGRYRPDADAYFRGEDPLALIRTVPALRGLRLSLSEGAAATARADPFRCCLVVDFLSAATEEAVRSALRMAGNAVVLASVPVQAAPRAVAADLGRAILRVDAARVDALIDMAGELVVAKNALALAVAQVERGQDPAACRALVAAASGIDRLSGRVHRAAMELRLVPLSRSFRRLPRIVRDIAGQLGRSVRFDISGQEIEADRSIVDGLYEPLLHVLRNAVDHGIEPPARRVAAGKPAEGRIALQAARDAGGRIAITVTDDGVGLDLTAIREAAMRRGVPGAEAATDAEAAELIFAPGFSTAAEVTPVSGRGVGMDAVRSAVAALGGSVAVLSARGQGCTIRISLPQAVLVTASLIVRAGGGRFGVPLDTVAETLRIPRAAISAVQAGQAFVLRGRAAPLIRLEQALRLGAGAARPADDAPARVLVVRAGDQFVGVEVDAIEGRADLVVRPLRGPLSSIAGVAGAALTADGGVMTVLDLPALAA